MSILSEYVGSLKVEAEGDDFRVVTASLRQMIMALPSPRRGCRNPLMIPDIPVRLILSTTPRIPAEIKKRVMETPHAALFEDSSLLGYCLNGRRYPPEIFLHDYFMQLEDSSGDLGDEVAWHELVHAIEGVAVSPDGHVTREIPWSYDLQQQMLAMDREANHEGIPTELATGVNRLHVEYLRGGTPLQENVSEIFARAAALYMLDIRHLGEAPKDLRSLFRLSADKADDAPLSPRGLVIRSELIVALASFSDPAQVLFFRQAREIIPRVARLYGCG